MLSPKYHFKRHLAKIHFPGYGTMKCDDTVPASDRTREISRLPRKLRQQRADPGQPLGFLLDVRPYQPDLSGKRAYPELSGHLRQPATGQSSAECAAAEREPVRIRVRRDPPRTPRRLGIRPVARRNAARSQAARFQAAGPDAVVRSGIRTDRLVPDPAARSAMLTRQA